MPGTKGKQTRRRLIEAARALFREKGYQGVSIREIARAAKIREASLYYYAPGGKEDLYVEVVKLDLDWYEKGVREVIQKAEPSAQAQLHAVAAWLLAQPPPPLFRLFETDVQFLSTENRERLLSQLFESLYAPLAAVFRNAQIRGELRAVDPLLLATQFLAALIGVQHSQAARLLTGDAPSLASQTVDIFLHGLAPPPEQEEPPANAET